MDVAVSAPGCQPAHGWLPAVVPEDARRFRVLDPALRATLREAGATLVEQDADVEIGSLAQLGPAAACAIVPMDAAVTEGAPRPFRAASRIARSLRVRARARATRGALERRGYPVADLYTWDLEQFVRRSGDREACRRLSAAGRFPLHAVAIAQKAPSRTVLEATLAHARATARLPEAGFGLPRVTQGKVIVVGTDSVLRVAVGPASRQLELAHAALDALSAADAPDEIARLVPSLLAYGRFGLASWSLESALPGAEVPPSVGDRLTESCIEFITALHPLGSVSADIRSPARDARVIAAAAGSTESTWLVPFAESLEERLADLPRGFAHGDFWSGNLLADGEQLTGVVDWDGGGPGRLPLLDLLHLRLCSYRSRTRELLGPGLVTYLLPWARSGGDALTRGYCRRLGLEHTPRLLEDMVVAYWLDRIAHELEMYADRVRRPFWMARNVHHVLAALPLRQSSAP